MTGPAPHFTIFTPTFDRAHTLGRGYEGLVGQTFRDFEWLIVDDGSKDGTEALVAGWQREGKISIRYFRQDHRGAHVATNLGVREARGEFFAKLDSDDAFNPDTLEKMWDHWLGIPEAERAHFVGVTGLCQDQTGELVGDRFPSSPLDSTPPELQYRHRVKGDKFGILRTAALREYPYPEDIKGNFIPEAILWNKIARHYRTRYVNDVVLKVWRDQPSLTRGRSKVTTNAEGHRLLFMSVLNDELRWLPSAPDKFVRAAANYLRFSWHCHVSLGSQWRALHGGMTKLLWLLSAPLGVPLYLRDRMTGRA